MTQVSIVNVQSVCEEAAHTSEGLRKLFGPKDSDTGTYFRQVPFQSTILFAWSQVLGYAAGSNSRLESTSPELLEELESALRPACLQVTFQPLILKDLKIGHCIAKLSLHLPLAE